MRQALFVGLVLALAGTPAHADPPLTVGPGGTHRTIQSAIDAARATGGAQEIRVAAAPRWRERLVVPLEAGLSLVLSGGWDTTFRARTGRSVLDGGGVGPVVGVSGRGGRLTVTGFEIVGGDSGTGTGGGMAIFIDGAHVEVVDNLFRDNHLVNPSGATGGGLAAFCRESAILRLTRNTFLRNSTQADDDEAGPQSAGAHVFADDRADVQVFANDFLENEVRGARQSHNAALNVTGSGFAHMLVDVNRFIGNRALSATGEGDGTVRLAALTFGLPGAPRLIAARNIMRGNQVDNPSSPQVNVEAEGGVVSVTDSVVADGNAGGVYALSRDGGSVHLTNLTVARHTDYGVSAGAPVAVSNTIFWENGRDLAGSASETANLHGVDPRFVDAARGDYHIGLGSPAIDAGDDAPPGGLSSRDIDDERRRQGLRVDIGADETPGDDGEPPCRVLEPLPVPRSAPICRCVSDPGLRAFRCGPLGPDVFLTLRAPIDWKEGTAVPVEWTIHPWTPVAGRYSMTAEALIDGQWVPQEWQGPTAPGLKEGQLVSEPFRLKLASQGRTPLRTALTYHRRGGKGPSRMVVEVLLPEAGTEAPKE